MATTLATLNSLINDRRRDTSSNSIDMTTDGFRAINGTLQVWNTIHDWIWQEERQIVQYNEGIDTYAVSSNFKAPIDLRPQKGSKTIEFEMMSPNKFDSRIVVPRRWAFPVIGQTQYQRIKHSGTKATIHPASDFDSDGTWTAGTGAANVSTDQYEFFDGPGSVKFDSVSATTLIISINDFSSVELERFQDRSNVYFNIFLPTVTNLSSIALKYGSSSSDHWSETVTTEYLGEAFVADVWNKIKINGWDTETGTPDIGAVDYLEVTLTYSVATTATGFRIENFFTSENIPLIHEYYSNDMVKDVSNSDAKLAIFNDSAATGDIPLWSGQWDHVNETFINNVLDPIFFMTGESTDMQLSVEKALELTTKLRERHPSRRRYPLKQMVPDINF